MEGLTNVAEHNYALLYPTKIALMLLASHPQACKVALVPQYSFSRHLLGFGYRKGLEDLVSGIDKEIFDLKETGTLQKIISKHVEVQSGGNDCEESAAALGYANLVVPRTILTSGIILALALALIELTLTKWTGVIGGNRRNSLLDSTKKVMFSAYLSEEQKIRTLQNLYASRAHVASLK